MSKSVKLLAKMKNMSFTLHKKKKKKHGLFGQPDSSQNKSECAGPSGQRSIDSAFGGNFPGPLLQALQRGDAGKLGGV